MDLKQDTENYIVLENNDLALVTGQEAIAQDIKRAINIWKREYFRDQSIGIDYEKVVFKKGVSSSIISTQFKNVILNVAGVLNIRDFAFTNANRSANITGTIVSKDGTFPFTTEE